MYRRGALLLGFVLAFLLQILAVTPGYSATALAIPEIAASALPGEARVTLALIKKGGPHPYARDGAVFGNYERLLPSQRRGYYREYTVTTPGARNRGARRIVAGTPGEYYYTEDHYRSFKRIRE